MTEAERKKLEAELAGKRGQLAQLEGVLGGTPHGGAAYQTTRGNMMGRIKQVRREIASVEEKLAAS